MEVHDKSLYIPIGKEVELFCMKGYKIHVSLRTAEHFYSINSLFALCNCHGKWNIPLDVSPCEGN